MTENLTKIIADRLTKHDIDIMRVEASIRRKIIAMINGLEKELINKLSKTDINNHENIKLNINRAERLAKSIDHDILILYRDINKLLVDSIDELSIIQAVLIASVVNEAIGVDLISLTTRDEVLKRLNRETLIEGANVRDFWKDQEENLKKSFVRTIRDGVTANETIDQLVRRVRGTRENKFKDGITQKFRNNASTIVRSSIFNALNQARMATLEKNSRAIKGVQWFSTLDTRTSNICKALDNQAWTLEGQKLPGTTLSWRGPPPAHFNCRSTLVPIVKQYSEIVKDPILAKKLQKLERAEKATIRASMDGNPDITTDFNYEKWLKKQDEETQIEALGKSRWEIWKKGKLSFTDLIDQTHNPLSINQLKSKFGGAE